jgi:hypothetical protein
MTEAKPPPQVRRKQARYGTGHGVEIPIISPVKRPSAPRSSNSSKISHISKPFSFAPVAPSRKLGEKTAILCASQCEPSKCPPPPPTVFIAYIVAISKSNAPLPAQGVKSNARGLPREGIFKIFYRIFVTVAFACDIISRSADAMKAILYSTFLCAITFVSGLNVFCSKNQAVQHYLHYLRSSKLTQQSPTRLSVFSLTLASNTVKDVCKRSYIFF